MTQVALQKEKSDLAFPLRVRHRRLIQVVIANEAFLSTNRAINKQRSFRECPRRYEPRHFSVLLRGLTSVDSRVNMPSLSCFPNDCKDSCVDSSDSII